LSSFGCAWRTTTTTAFWISTWPTAAGGNQAQDNFLYHNNGIATLDQHHVCRFAYPNRSAIGTKVRLQATIGGRPLAVAGDLRRQWLQGQNDPRRELRLGDATTSNGPHRMAVVHCSEMHIVAVKRFLTITEPT